MESSGFVLCPVSLASFHHHVKLSPRFTLVQFLSAELSLVSFNLSIFDFQHLNHDNCIENNEPASFLYPSRGANVGV